MSPFEVHALREIAQLPLRLAALAALPRRTEAQDCLLLRLFGELDALRRDYSHPRACLLLPGRSAALALATRWLTTLAPVGTWPGLTREATLRRLLALSGFNTRQALDLPRPLLRRLRAHHSTPLPTDTPRIRALATRLRHTP